MWIIRDGSVMWRGDPKDAQIINLISDVLAGKERINTLDYNEFNAEQLNEKSKVDLKEIDEAKSYI